MAALRPTAGPATPAAWGTTAACHASRSWHHPQGTPWRAWLCLLLLLTPCVPVAGTDPGISPGTSPGTNPGTNPGIRARLTQRALEFGRRFGLEQLQSLLLKEHELNLRGSYVRPLLGTFSYAVPRIRIHELQMNDSALGFVEAVGLKLTLQRARIRLSADWEAQMGALQDKGSIEVQMRDLALEVVLGLSVDGDGRPRVWNSSCEAQGTHLHMEFHSGHSWLYNLLAPLLQRTLRKELNKQLCLELRRGIVKLEAALQQMEVCTQLDHLVTMDHSLLGQPDITPGHGDVALKGEFFRAGMCQQRPSSPGLAAPPVALPAAQEPMLLLAISQFVANSAASAYFAAGALRRTLSSSTLPRRFPLQLNTKSIGVFSPQLQELYPDQPMELQLSARRQPLLSCRPSALHGALFTSAEAFVVLPNATRVPAFLLNIDANVTGKPAITGNRLGGTVSLTGLSVAQVTSHMGPVEVKKLETLLKFGLWLFGVPWANKRLRAGIPVPALHGLSLHNPRLSLQEGFVLIATDLQYQT